MSKHLQITAKAEGFRRAGRAWSETPTTVDPAAFDAAAIQALRSEPKLVVVEVDSPKPEGPPKPEKPTK